MGVIESVLQSRRRIHPAGGGEWRGERRYQVAKFL